MPKLIIGNKGTYFETYIKTNSKKLIQASGIICNILTCNNKQTQYQELLTNTKMDNIIAIFA